MRHKTLGEIHYKVADTLHSIGLLDESEEKLGEALENFQKAGDDGTWVLIIQRPESRWRVWRD